MPLAGTNPSAAFVHSSSDLGLKSILVATDFGPCSDKPIRYAAALARRYGAKFYLMNVVSSLGFTMVGPHSLVAAAELAWKAGHAAKAELIRKGTLRDLEVEVVVRTGEIWPELESEVRAQKIEMLVVGTHSRQGLGRLVLGSVAEQIFRHASCPVLTVGPNSPAQAENVISDTLCPVVFATDLTPESLVALPHAISYANRRKTRLALLHVLSPVPHVDGNRWYTASDVVEMRHEAEAAMKCRLLELVSNSRLELEPMCIAQVGSAVDGIIQTSRALNAMGIVLGLKPRGEAISHMPWSTAYQIVCGASCPVLTVRG